MVRHEIKQLMSAFGVYRPARWLKTQLFSREEIETHRREVEVYAPFVKPGDVVFDVGANVGDKTRVFLALGAKVVAFEPQPDMRAELLRRCGKNARLTVLDKAVGPEPGKAKLFVRKHRGTSGLVADWEDSPVEEEIEVEVTTLDEVIRTHGVPSFIKIDIEGYEYQALRGLSKRVDCIAFEFHLTERDGTRHHKDLQKVSDCLEHLAKLGEISVNVSPAKKMRMVYSQWRNGDGFLAEIMGIDASKLDPDPRPDSLSETYGDVFVRVQDRA